MNLQKVESEAQTGLGILVIVFILSFVVFFEIGLGAIPWQIGGEIFPDGPRATAMSKIFQRKHFISCLNRILNSFALQVLLLV